MNGNQNKQAVKKQYLIILVLLQIWAVKAAAQIVNYPAPQGAALNNDFTIKVKQGSQKWQTVAAYTAMVNNVIGTKSNIENTSFAYFDFSGRVEVMVTSNKAIVQGADIKPVSAGVAAKITGNIIAFSLDRPCNLSIEINGDRFHNLQLFANGLEVNKPLSADTGLYYFGPGIHNIGSLKVPSNKKVYIAGGAVVEGQLLIDHAENIKVYGRGILTQLPQQNAKDETGAISRQNQRGSRNDELTINFSKNVAVDGIILLPHKYSVFIGQSKDVSINNIKSFSSEGNADGLDIFCSSNINIDHIFMRNADDCIAIYGHRWNFYGNTQNVKVSNSILWADVAHPILAGTHGDPQHPDTLGNMQFTNIDILDQHENQLDYQGCIALNAGDANLIKDIKFENIRIADIRKGQLFNLRVMYNHKYNTAAGMGIENIYFKDISYTGHNAGMSIIAGYDEGHMVKNITFENLNINGTVIADDMSGKPGFYKTGDMANIFIGEHVGEVRFIKGDTIK